MINWFLVTEQWTTEIMYVQIEPRMTAFLTFAIMELELSVDSKEVQKGWRTILGLVNPYTSCCNR